MPEETRKLFDVAHPGKSPADAASKPVIVSNRPVMQDPMMLRHDEAIKSLPPHGGGLMPVHDNVVPEEPLLGQKAEPVADTNVMVNEEPQFGKLIEDGAYFVHVKGARSSKLFARIFLLAGALIAMAALGYYTVTFLKK